MKMLHLEWINNKVILCSTGNFIQSSEINHNGKEYKKRMYICISVQQKLAQQYKSTILKTHTHTHTHTQWITTKNDQPTGVCWAQMFYQASGGACWREGDVTHHRADGVGGHGPGFADQEGTGRGVTGIGERCSKARSQWSHDHNGKPGRIHERTAWELNTQSKVSTASSSC